MQSLNRRTFLKSTGTLALAAITSGLLCGAAAEPEETEPDTALCTVGGVRVLDVRARVYDYPNSDYPYHMEVYFDLENANDFTAYFHQENYIVSVGGKRYDTSDFTGLNKWNGSRYIQDVWLEPGEAKTITYSCRLDKAGGKAAFQDGMQITFQYRQQRQTFISLPLTKTSSACALDGPVQSTVFPAVGGVQFSDFWCHESSTQNGRYALHLNFTMQNLTDTQIDLPIPDLHPNDNLPNHFTLQFDGTEKYLYGPYSCEYSWMRPKSKDALEALAPYESQFAELSFSLTQNEFDTLLTQDHTIEFTFTCGGEELTLRGNPSTCIFEVV